MVRVKDAKAIDIVQERGVELMGQGSAGSLEGTEGLKEL